MYMRESESILIMIVNQIKSYGESEEDVCGREDSPLTIKFDFVVCAVEGSKDIELMTMDQLMGSLQAYEDSKEDTMSVYNKSSMSKLL